jgi:predicted transcriptional regulator
MSEILDVYIDDKTQARLTKLSKEMGRSMSDLAEAAVSEAALASTEQALRMRREDPESMLISRGGSLIAIFWNRGPMVRISDEPA